MRVEVSVPQGHRGQREEEVAESGEDGEDMLPKTPWGFKFYPKSSEE